MDIKFSPEFLGGKLYKVANDEFKGFTSEDLAKIKEELLRIFERTYQAIFDIMKNFSDQPWKEIELGIAEVLKQRNILVADSIKNLEELNELIEGLEKTLKDMVKAVEEEEDIAKAREDVPVPEGAPKAAVKRTAIEEGSHFQEGNWAKEVKAVGAVWWNRATPDQRSAILKSMGYSAEAQEFWKDTEWKDLDEELQDELRDEAVPKMASIEDFKEGDEVIDVKTGRLGKVFLVDKLVGKIGVIINGKEEYFAPSELATQLSFAASKEGAEAPFR